MQPEASLGPVQDKNLPKENFIRSTRFRWLIAGIIALIALLLVFQAGVFIGLRKARFSYRWSEQYHHVFGGPRGGVLQDFQGRDFINGHGTAGFVVKVDTNSFIIKGRDGVEKNIMATNTTSIEKGRVALKISDIRVDDSVVVIGSPADDGSIDAKLIRVFDTAAADAPFHIGTTPLFK